jgi:hypothetical protein
MARSENIVNFINHLLPAYTYEKVNDTICARSLIDGTLILPIDDPEEEEHDGSSAFVMVHWQGDPNRQTTVLGSQFAAVAIAKHFELQAVLHGKPPAKEEVRDLVRHYAIKTGEALIYSDAEDDANLSPLISKAVKKLGEVAVVQLLRKAIGM